MATIKDITNDFGTLYYPKSALLFYETKGNHTDIYVEHFDMDSNGNPVNAHPLSVREANRLSKALHTQTEKDNAFLKPKGILPINILYIDPSADKASVVWYTKAQQKQLFFVESLGIPNGTANVPPMLWKADKHSLRVFALKSERRPNDTTRLYHAPFFNIYEDGKVCMGTVNIDIQKSASVEEFVQAWESYFFHSYFSHLIDHHNPIKGNCVHLWKELVNTNQPFPKNILKPYAKTLKNLL